MESGRVVDGSGIETTDAPEEAGAEEARQLALDPDKRAQILEGARQVFRAKGYDGASMGDIARAAGVSKGTLYVYFASKEALFTTLALTEKRAQAEALFAIAKDEPDLKRALRLLAYSFLELMIRPEHISNVRMVMAAAEKFPKLGREFYEAGPAAGLARLQRCLDNHRAAGRLRPCDTRLAAQHFFDLAQAGVLRRMLFGAGEAPSPEERARLADEAVRVFLAAYGPE